MWTAVAVALCMCVLVACSASSAGGSGPAKQDPMATEKARFEQAYFELGCTINAGERPGSSRIKSPMVELARLESDDPGLIKTYERDVLAKYKYGTYGEFKTIFKTLTADPKYGPALDGRYRDHLKGCL